VRAVRADRSPWRSGGEDARCGTVNAGALSRADPAIAQCRDIRLGAPVAPVLLMVSAKPCLVRYYIDGQGVKQGPQFPGPMRDWFQQGAHHDFRHQHCTWRAARGPDAYVRAMCCRSATDPPPGAHVRALPRLSMLRCLRHFTCDAQGFFPADTTTVAPSFSGEIPRAAAFRTIADTFPAPVPETAFVAAPGVAHFPPDRLPSVRTLSRQDA